MRAIQSVKSSLRLISRPIDDRQLRQYSLEKGFLAQIIPAHEYKPWRFMACPLYRRAQSHEAIVTMAQLPVAQPHSRKARNNAFARQLDQHILVSQA